MTTALVLMYVYFDNNGDIKAITPSENNVIGKEYDYVMLPLKEVEPFIMGIRNTFEYTIKKIKKPGGHTYKLLKKFSEINVTRSLDSYLTKVPNDTFDEYVLKIVAHTKSSKISLVMSPSYKEMYQYGSEEQIEEIDTFINSPKSIIYITEKNNPYNLYYNLEFLPRELFEKSMLDFQISKAVDLRNTSVYTKRLVDSYCYSIREK